MHLGAGSNLYSYSYVSCGTECPFLKNEFSEHLKVSNLLTMYCDHFDCGSEHSKTARQSILMSHYSSE